MSGLFPDLSGAVLSPCGRFRYLLWRYFTEEPRNPLNALMLNPSTADATLNDNTITVLTERARRLDHDALLVTNFYAYRSTDPERLWDGSTEDPIGPDNDRWIVETAARASRVLCAWGAFPKARGRAVQVRELLRPYGEKTCCIRLSKGGMPVHPLYQSYTPIRPVPLDLSTLSLETKR